MDAVGALVRGLSIALTLLLVAAATLATVTVVIDLLDGAPEFKSPGPLLATGFLVWLDVNITFSLLYWELDGGGAAHRLRHPPSHPDLAFVQHVNPDLAPPGWHPTFSDYLYLGLTNSPHVQRHGRHADGPLGEVLHGFPIDPVGFAILTLVIANTVNLLG